MTAMITTRTMTGQRPIQHQPDNKKVKYNGDDADKNDNTYHNRNINDDDKNDEDNGTSKFDRKGHSLNNDTGNNPSISADH